MRLHGQLDELQLEPFALSGLLCDVAHQLEPYAKQYGVRLELDMPTQLVPVVSDRSVLQSALASLGQVFVRAEAEADETRPVHLAAYRSRYGQVAGLYGLHPDMNAAVLRRARSLHTGGVAHQPMAKLVHGSAAGVFVADNLLRSVAARLHVARYHNLTGLATTLPPCSQLQLV